MTNHEITFGHFGHSDIPNYLSEAPFNVQLIDIRKNKIDDTEEIITFTIWDGSRALGTTKNIYYTSNLTKPQIIYHYLTEAAYDSDDERELDELLWRVIRITESEVFQEYEKTNNLYKMRCITFNPTKATVILIPEYPSS